MIGPLGKVLCSGACGSDPAVFKENYGVLINNVEKIQFSNEMHNILITFQNIVILKFQLLYQQHLL